MPVQLPDIIQGDIVVREETTVKHQVLAANQRGQGQGGEGLGEDLEHALVVFGLALAFKAVHAVHIICLVVSTVEEELIWPQPLVCVEEECNFRGPGAAVDKIAVEEICVCIRWVSV